MAIQAVLQRRNSPEIHNSPRLRVIVIGSPNMGKTLFVQSFLGLTTSSPHTSLADSTGKETHMPEITRRWKCYPTSSPIETRHLSCYEVNVHMNPMLDDGVGLRGDVQKDIMYDARYAYAINQWKRYVSLQIADKSSECPCYNAYKLAEESHHRYQSCDSCRYNSYNNTRNEGGDHNDYDDDAQHSSDMAVKLQPSYVHQCSLSHDALTESCVKQATSQTSQTSPGMSLSSMSPKSPSMKR